MDEKLGTRLNAVRAEAVQRALAAEAMLAELTLARESSNDDDEHDPEGVTLSSEWSRLTGLADAARAEVRLADAAVERFRLGTYGLCARCGKPIPAARLEVRPFAEHCVPCAEALAR